MLLYINVGRSAYLGKIAVHYLWISCRIGNCVSSNTQTGLKLPKDIAKNAIIFDGQKRIKKAKKA
jgi:hypothetical protein